MEHFLFDKNFGLAEMLKRGRGGKIVNLASQAGVAALEGHAAYCASKAAISV